MRVDLGGAWVGDGEPCYVVAELGINHNGDVGVADRMIAEAALGGAQAVKLQKRTVDVVYSPEQLAMPRESPWGTTTREQKLGLEFDGDAYRYLASRAWSHRVAITASCWDEQALDEVCTWIEPPWLKVASAVLTWPSRIRDPLLRAHRATGKPLVISTGMSDLEQIDEALELVDGADVVLLACTSTYPADVHELHLRTIATLRERYGLPVGYSGHERGVGTTVAAAVLGACLVERHITLDRSMYGSDQAASLEPQGFARMVRDIRNNERALGTGDKRCLQSEEPVRAKLARRS